MHIDRLCDISSGYTTRRLEPAPADGLLAVRLGDIHGTDPIRAEDLYRYQFGRVSDRYLVQGGEVVFKSRGKSREDPSTAAVVSTALGEPAVVTLPLLILRPHRHLVCADYLAWAINQPDAQHRLKRESQGTDLYMVPKTVLERLHIPLPDLDTQRRIATIHALAQREGHLLRQLAQRRQDRTGFMLNELAKLTPQHEHQHHPQ